MFPHFTRRKIALSMAALAVWVSPAGVVAQVAVGQAAPSFSLMV